MRRLLALLLLPLRPTPLILIVIFAIGLALAAAGGLLGVPLALILLSWFFKYTYVVLDTTARGFGEPPVLSVEMVNPVDEQRPLGQLLIIGVFYGGTGAAEPLIGTAAVAALRAGAVALLPASIAVLGVTGSILEAINPVVLVKMIRRLGPSYLMISAATAAPAALAWLIAAPAIQSGKVPLVALLALMMYACLAAFSVIGGVLYDKRIELGLDAWKTPERDKARLQRETDRRHERLIDELYGHWRSGARTEALHAARQWLASQGHAFAEYDWLCERLLAWPDHRLAHRLAQDFITALLEAKDAAHALAVVRRHLDVAADFRPVRAAELIHLVHVARDAGDRALARRLLTDFERHYANDPATGVARELQKDLAR